VLTALFFGERLLEDSIPVSSLTSLRFPSPFLGAHTTDDLGLLAGFLKAKLEH
jgi:hypothetical protein